MNTRDATFDCATRGSRAPAQEPICRHNVVQVINPGPLQVDTGLFRVVWANRKSDGAFLLRFPGRQEEESEVSTGRRRVKPKLSFPTRVSLAVLEELAGKRWVIKTRAYLPKGLRKETDELSTFEKKVKMRRKTLVSSFMADDDLIRIFEFGQMGRHVTRTVEAYNATLAEDDKKLTRHHVYQVVYRYWLYGCVDSALISDSGNCGAPGKYRNPGKTKRGRPRARVATGHAPDKLGVNTGPDERALIWLAWDNYGSKLGKYSAAYNKMVDDYYTDGWEQDSSGIWSPSESKLANRPSLETFRYYVKRKYTPVELLQQLVPRITWEQTRRALQGKAFEKLFGPCHTFMIDSTVADVYLVSEFNPYWIIGRPIVYLVRDVWSGIIVGLHVALEGPSWDTARLAVYNAFSPKGEYLRFFGFDLGDEAWACAHGCLNLVHDRGEHLSIPSIDSANELGIVLSPCPSFRPDLKGAIETMFDWINDISVHWLPGAVLSRQRERGQRDHRLDAKLTLYRFTRILIHAILTFNKTADMRDRLVGRIAGLEIKATPENLWRWGLENLNGSPPQWDPETLYKALLPSGDASIRADGVRFAERRYQGAYADNEQWQAFARSFPSRKLKVKYHPNNPRQIFVLNQASGNYETLTMTAGEQIPTHARHEEIFDALKYRQLVHEEDEDVRMLDRIGHDRFRAEEVAKAEAAQANAVPPDSKAEHLSHIRDKRAFEATVLRLLENARQMPRENAERDELQLSSSCDAPSDLLSALLTKTAEEIGHD